MTAPSPLALPMNHVFLDYENVHQVDLALIGAKSVSFTLMVGPKQTKLDSDLVEKLMVYSLSVQLVKLKFSGKNALDLALAYYLGRAALADPTGYFHIVSKDGGFDPLIEHLRARHINVQRHKCFADLTFTWPGKKAAVSEPIVEKAVAKKMAAKKVSKKTVTKKVAKKAVDKLNSEETWTERVLNDFKEHPKAQPKKRKTLIAKVANLINKKVDGPEVKMVIELMVKAGKLQFDGKDVPQYHLK